MVQGDWTRCLHPQREQRSRADLLEAELDMAHKDVEAGGTEEKLQSIIKARDGYVAQVLKANERLRETNDGLRDEVKELKEMVETLRSRGEPGS